MNSDTYFHKGKNDHTACQDYAISFNQDESIKHVILSDGCSSSSDTDVGSRILALCARKRMSQESPVGDSSFFKKIAEDAESVVSALSLPSESIDATLLILSIIGRTVCFWGYGDGYFIIRYKDGSLKITKLDYKNGYPKYASYLIDDERYEQFSKMNQNTTIETTILDKDGNQKSKTTEEVDDGRDAFYCCISDDFDSIESVFVTSDGLNSFSKNDNGSLSPVSPIEIARHLTAIKGYAGHFVTRRAFKFLTKECEKLCYQHYDDVSVAGINIG